MKRGTTEGEFFGGSIKKRRRPQEHLALAPLPDLAELGFVPLEGVLHNLRNDLNLDAWPNLADLPPWPSPETLTFDVGAVDWPISSESNRPRRQNATKRQRISGQVRAPRPRRMNTLTRLPAAAPEAS